VKEKVKRKRKAKAKGGVESELGGELGGAGGGGTEGEEGKVEGEPKVKAKRKRKARAKGGVEGEEDGEGEDGAASKRQKSAAGSPVAKARAKSALGTSSPAGSAPGTSSPGGKSSGKVSSLCGVIVMNSQTVHIQRGQVHEYIYIYRSPGQRRARRTLALLHRER